jgi:hypothetical protein
MFSPSRNEDCDPVLNTPGRIMTTPLKAITSPFYEAVKSAHSKATRDFDRFYETLQATMSPRTSEVNINI